MGTYVKRDGGDEVTVGAGAARKVVHGVLEDLDRGRVVPGQRLVETELAGRFGVGRNAVREAMQQLAARGVIDLVRNRSGAIRLFDLQETLEVLDVAEALTSLAVRGAAARIGISPATPEFSAAMAELEAPETALDPGRFNRARRHFYRALLAIGGNRELGRLFPAIAIHIIYSQHQTRELRDIRVADYRAISTAVLAGDAPAAERAVRDHVANVRTVIGALFAGPGLTSRSARSAIR